MPKEDLTKEQAQEKLDAFTATVGDLAKESGIDHFVYAAKIDCAGNESVAATYLRGKTLDCMGLAEIIRARSVAPMQEIVNRIVENLSNHERTP